MTTDIAIALRKESRINVGHALFHDKNNVAFGFKSIIQLNKIHVVQLIHDIDFILYFILQTNQEQNKVGPEIL